MILVPDIGNQTYFPTHLFRKTCKDTHRNRNLNKQALIHLMMTKLPILPCAEKLES